jgi:hypothetical protein
VFSACKRTCRCRECQGVASNTADWREHLQLQTGQGTTFVIYVPQNVGKAEQVRAQRTAKSRAIHLLLIGEGITAS